MKEAYAAMVAVFAECARAARTDCEEKVVAACRGYLPNHTVGQVLAHHLEQVGAPRWTRDDVAWMRQLSAAASPGQPFELPRSLAFWTEGIDYYGQDDGDLSWVVPLGRVNWAYPAGVPIHHWAWTALSGHPASSPGPLMASEALAAAALDLLTRPDTVAAAKAELDERRGGRAVEIPETGIADVMARDPAAFWEARW